MKKLTFVFLSIFIVLQAKSQIVLEANAGFGFYSLKDLKTMQTEMVASAGLPNLKSVEAFPNNLFYSFLVNYSFNENNRIGLEFSYLTTGGRNHLADYSGEYKLDMILKGYKIGAKYQYLIFNHEKLSIGIQGTGGIIASRLKINENLRLYDEELMDDQFKMKGIGVFLEPSLKLSYTILNNLCINLNGGYEFDLKNSLRLDGRKTELLSSWSGTRLSVGVAYNIDFKK